MIEKIRKTLIIKYTLIIAAILSFGFTGSYIAYRHNGVKLFYDGLDDYLSEEVREAREFLKEYDGKTEVYKVKSDIKSLHNFSYWIVDKQIVHAERSEYEPIAEVLEHRLLTRQYEEGKTYHENLKHNRQKWYFIVAKKKLSPEIAPNGEVFVISNYTPVRKNAKAYIQVAVWALLIMTILSYLLGSFFATRSMAYIEQSYEKQKKFVSDAAHELRTPLAILYSYSELLEYSSHKKDVLNRMKTEIQQMNDLLDRLLSIARYDNSAVVLQKENISLYQIISDTVYAMQQLYPKADFRFKMSDTSVCLKADEVLIRELISILLDNAVKYTTEDKKIEVEVSKSHSNLKVSIKDNGIGIKEEDLPHIFDRFWRAENSRHQKSLGLGLSIAERIVSLHQGSISVKSKVGKGTTFEILFHLS